MDFGDADHNSLYTLHGGAYISSVDGTKALRVGGGKTAELSIDINPSKMTDCTIEVRFKLLSVANHLGWLVSSDNGGYDRGVILHDARFGGGVAAVPGRTYNSGLPSPPLGQWSHVMVVYRQGGESVAYLNGDKGIPISPTWNNEGRSTVTVGSAFKNGDFGHAPDAWVQSVTFWNEALSPPPLPLPPPPPTPAPPSPCTSGNASCACAAGAVTGPTYTCTAWGDPHYTTFGGLVHDFYGKGLYEHARFAIAPCGCEVVIQTLLATLGRASAIAAIAVRVGDTTVEITGGGDVTIRQLGGSSSSRSLRDGGPDHAHFCDGGCMLQRENRASRWRLHLPGGAGDFLVVPRAYTHGRTRGFYYDAWLRVARSVIDDHLACASGLCTAGCPSTVMPALPPSAECNASPVQCYRVPADDAVFAEPTLRNLEQADGQNVTRACPSDPRLTGLPSSPSLPPASLNDSMVDAACHAAGIPPANARDLCDGVGESRELRLMCAFDYCATDGDVSIVDAYQNVNDIDVEEKKPRPPPSPSSPPASPSPPPALPTCKPNRNMICSELYDSCMHSPAFD